MTGGLSLRDRAILVIVVFLALYGLAAALWFMKFDREWSTSRKKYESALKTYRDETALIAKRDSLRANFEEERDKIPVLGDDQPEDTHWMQILTTLADEHKIAITDKKPGHEEKEDTLYKIEVELKGAAALRNLVKFLYALETADHAMFDVKSLNVMASGRNSGYLKVEMTVCCAYLRD